jgi:hypothetical protein
MQSTRPEQALSLARFRASAPRGDAVFVSHVRDSLAIHLSH